VNLSKPICTFTLLGMRATALFAAAAFLAELAGAQPSRAKLSENQIAALIHLRASRSLVHGGGKPYLDPPNGMTVVTPVSATTLATTLLGAGVTLSGTPTFQGAAAQGGTFTNAPALVGFTSGIILSSGNVADAGSTYAGPDLPDTDEGTGGYAPLSALIGGQATTDAAVLQFSFIPNTSTIYFSYVFASAEYPNYIGSFNDPMALFVNGTAPGNNVAVLPLSPPVAVTINNVNTTSHPTYFNKFNGIGDALPYGGETKVLTAIATVTPGQVNTITLAVADALDHALDSAVFIQAGSLSTTPPGATTVVASVPALSPLAFAALCFILLLSGALLLRRTPAAGPQGRRG
jgi:hypothetical protein